MNWFEESNFWSRFYEFMFPPDSFENAATHVDDIKKLLDLKTATILDLCCGPGRHCIPLKKAGFEVTINLYSGAELRDLLEQAGFVNVKIYGDLKGFPYNQNAKRLIAVGQKQ